MLGLGHSVNSLFRNPCEVLHHFSKSCHGSHIAIAGSGDAESQCLGNFGIPKVFKMTQCEYLAVDLVH